MNNSCKILSFIEFVNEEYDAINELKYSYIYKRTPKRYKDRATDIKVKFLTRKGKKYYYQTFTNSNGNKHKQWVMPLYPKLPFDSLEDHVVSHCDCNDFRYENEWLLWTKNASNLISSNRQPLKRMNPQRIPKFCKHLTALKEDLHKRLISSP